MPSYLDNLQRLGLIRFDYSSVLIASQEYASLESDSLLDKLKERVIADGGEVRFKRGIAELTQYGRHFGRACVIDHELAASRS